MIGLAPVLDLEAGYRANLGPGAVEHFLGGSPETVPARYAEASVPARLPLGLPQWLLHGAEDRVVPPAMSRKYATAAHAAGDNVTYGALRGLDHMALIDPESSAFPILRKYLLAACYQHEADGIPPTNDPHDS